MEIWRRSALEKEQDDDGRGRVTGKRCDMEEAAEEKDLVSLDEIDRQWTVEENREREHL